MARRFWCIERESYYECKISAVDCGYWQRRIGKSTVCEHLIKYVKHYGPAVQVHLGKQAGNVGRAAAKLPLLGRSVGKAIESNTKKVKTKKSRIGLLPSAVIIAFVGRRLLRFRRMLAFRRQGFIVLTDRFPQVQIPGAYDGTVFPVDVEGSRFVRWLAARERAAFQWMAGQKPDLVLKLNVSLERGPARVNPITAKRRWKRRLPSRRY